MTTSVTAAPSPPVAPVTGGGIMRHLNVATGIVMGVLLATATWWVTSSTFPIVDEGDHKDDAVTILTLVAWVIGFLIGVGAFVGPVRWLLGRDLTVGDEHYLAGKDAGVARYFRFTTDHKVVGMQYLVTTMVLFGFGGALAMLIRTNLITPGSRFVDPATYNSLVGIHGITMIIATIIMVSGPFGNFILPIMIGARDMAFPRLNALSFWLLFAAVPVLISSLLLGGISTGWSAYAPLSDQANRGMDAFLVTIVTFAISTGVAGMNITTTAVRMRARGMTWSRTPIFVFGTVASVALGLVAFPMFEVAMIELGMDRGMGAGFYDPSIGGSGWLYANLFWLMGHPEVYVILLPAIVALMEITPVFTRKPLFSFTSAILGIMGIAGLSLFVWAHHMYVAGWAPVLGGPFMVTTELISIPTGLLFLVLLGTLWRGRVWMRLPVMAVYALLWNFTIGGITGIYLSDIPVDQAMHGSMFVTAHFHYTLMGAGLTGAMGALAYWFPKMTGRLLHEKAGAIGFWVAQVGFNVTFMGMFAVGLAGQPRRVADPGTYFRVGNLISSIGAYTIMLGMLTFLGAIIYSWRAGAVASANPWGARTLEWQTPTPVPLENFEVLPVVTQDFYGYGEDGHRVAAGDAAAGDLAAPGAPPQHGPDAPPQRVEVGAP